MRRLSLLSPGPMGDMFEDIDRLMDGFMRPNYSVAGAWQPGVEINQTDDHYVVSLDMPGVKKDDLKIEVQGQQLWIAGERQDRYGKFERTFTLPESVDTAKIEAHLENGVLSVALPKAEKAKARAIQVQTGHGGFFSKLLESKKEETKQLNEVGA